MNWLRIALLKILAFVVLRCYHFLCVVLYAGKKTVVPSVTDPLLLHSATTLAAKIRGRKISSESLVRAYINRIREVNPYINAVVDNRFTEAIEEAKAVDALIASGSHSIEALKKEKPLLGVPFTAKLFLAVKGLRCTAGSLIFQNLTAHEDALTISQMKRAGAICVANTNAPEFGFSFETYNKVHGMTTNPYDTRRTCGGSSGGEAALIASAGSVIGIGNDMGGSCRFPAFNCCIFGHKPTAGLVSNYGAFPVVPPKLDNIVTAGPLCRYAEDLITVMKVLAEDKAKEIHIDKTVNFKDVKFYYMLGDDKNVLVPKLDQDLEESIKNVLRYFESSYAATSQIVDFKGMSNTFELWIRTLVSCREEDSFQKLTGSKVHISPSKELVKFIFQSSKFCLGSVFAFNGCRLLDVLTGKKLCTKFKECVNQLEKEFNEILDDNSVLFLPTFPTTATYPNETILMNAAVGYMAIFNLLGNPVTQCTLGLGSNGMPIGLQVVAGKNRDYLTLSVARELEKAFGGWVPPGKRCAKNDQSIINNGFPLNEEKVIE